MEYVKVIKPGLLSTIQDLGRHEFRKYGVSVSGAMDPLSLRFGNLLVGNDENEAAIEVTLIGPTLRFESETVFAITGADLSPKLNGESISLWKVIKATPGDELSFAECRYGCRAYIAIAGGINVPKIMGSRATYIRGNYGGLEGRPLKRGDKLPLGKPSININFLKGRKLRYKDIPDLRTKRPVRYIAGPHINQFEEDSIRNFLSTSYILSNESDRMGYRLEGERLVHKNGADIISDFITVGTIQIPGNGVPIIHMADCGTSGGYTKLGVIISIDISYVAQKKPGDEISFREIKIEEAHKEIAKIEETISEIKINNRILKLKNNQ